MNRGESGAPDGGKSGGILSAMVGSRREVIQHYIFLNFISLFSLPIKGS